MSINSLAVNAGAFRHALLVVGSLRAVATLKTTRRTSAAVHSRFYAGGNVDFTRRVALADDTLLAFQSSSVFGQKSSVVIIDEAHFVSETNATKRMRIAERDQLLLVGTVDATRRRSAVITGKQKFLGYAHAKRRLSASVDQYLAFMEYCRVKTLARLAANANINFHEENNIVRRCAISTRGEQRFNENVKAIIRRQATATSSIALLSQIRVPHVKFSENSYWRTIIVSVDPRYLIVPRDVRLLEDRDIR